jgi:hypothetical protein
MKNFTVVVVFLTALSTSLISGEATVRPRAYIDSDGPGWRALGPADFSPVNSAPDTWSWSADGLHCTGQPISAGNSGVFVWTTPASIKRLTAAGRPGLPDGIEVQIFDHGYTAEYRRRNPTKAADWFTTNGDIFPVRAKLTPFPPLSPDGSRSFPRRQLSRGAGEWNHYYIRAINGEIRLWVNGEEVSGGTAADPATGFLCLESEGSPIHFRTLRIRELP